MCSEVGELRIEYKWFSISPYNYHQMLFVRCTARLINRNDAQALQSAGVMLVFIEQIGIVAMHTLIVNTLN